jgi:hypothetical protein
MIDPKLPKDWKDLENKVAQILTEAGLKTSVEKDIDTVRVRTNVDVVAVDESQFPNVCYLCECKYWKSNVPLEKVNALRSTVTDYGANFGIIISKSGFQPGAYEAAMKTNIRLVNWFEFQEMFEDKWWRAICLILYKDFDTLINYADITPFLNFKTRRWKQIENDELKCKQFAKLLTKYRDIGYEFMGLGVEALMHLPPAKPTFPMDFKIPSSQNITRTKRLNSLREYTDCLLFYGKKALTDFAQLFPDNST